MTLSDFKIKKLNEEQKIINPWNELNLGPSSYDLTLGRKFLIPSNTGGVVRMDEKFHYIEMDISRLIIPSGMFVLATTQEEVYIPSGYVGFVEGRSSVGRRGLFVQNAGFIDGGFKGKITLELFNASNVSLEIEAGRRICQLVIFESYPCEIPYNLRRGSKYYGQQDVQGSKLEQDL